MNLAETKIECYNFLTRTKRKSKFDEIVTVIFECTRGLTAQGNPERWGLWGRTEHKDHEKGPCINCSPQNVMVWFFVSLSHWRQSEMRTVSSVNLLSVFHWRILYNLVYFVIVFCVVCLLFWGGGSFLQVDTLSTLAPLSSHALVAPHHTLSPSPHAVSPLAPRCLSPHHTLSLPSPHAVFSPHHTISPLTA